MVTGRPTFLSPAPPPPAVSPTDSSHEEEELVADVLFSPLYLHLHLQYQHKSPAEESQDKSEARRKNNSVLAARTLSYVRNLLELGFQPYTLQFRAVQCGAVQFSVGQCSAV